MWELGRAVVGTPGIVEGYLKEEYEPFAVTLDSFLGEIVWFKRNLKEVYPPYEVHSESNLVKRTGRRATTDSKK